jgi:4-hydroxy-tetrahydrodipicolinate synthase
LHGLLTRFPGFGTFTGNELFFLKMLRMGGAGTINAVANVIAPIERTLFDNYESPEAEQWQETIGQLRPAYQGLAPIPALKQLVAHRRNDPAWLGVRPPLVQLSETQAAEFLAKVDQLPVMAEAVA